MGETGMHTECWCIYLEQEQGDKIKVDHREIDCEVDRNGSKSSPMKGFGIISAECLNFAIIVSEVMSQRVH
jgi:hypothetical protein